jgi:hypothetical protein
LENFGDDRMRLFLLLPITIVQGAQRLSDNAHTQKSRDAGPEKIPLQRFLGIRGREDF